MIAARPGAHLLEAGYDVRRVRELLGRRDVRTTMIDTHVLNRGALGVGARWMGYRDRAGGGVGTGAGAFDVRLTPGDGPTVSYPSVFEDRAR